MAGNQPAPSNGEKSLVKILLYQARPSSLIPSVMVHSHYKVNRLMELLSALLKTLRFSFGGILEFSSCIARRKPMFLAMMPLMIGKIPVFSMVNYNP